jgi:pimeloyl-ACP methyl ester carboxylesterase
MMSIITMKQISNLRALFLAATVALGAAGCASETAQKSASHYNETPNQYVNVQGVRIAYRTLGTDTGEPPLVLFHHFGAAMDDWDPEVVEGLARGRRVYVFDSAGVGASGGKTPDSIPDMARVAEAFVGSLGLRQVDILGFSMGGAVAQQFLIDKPSVVRKAVLVGTAAQGTKGVLNLPKVVVDAFKRAAEEKTDPRVFLFFTDTADGKLAAKEYVGRINKHTVDPSPKVSDDVRKVQLKAIMTSAGSPPNDAQLAAITQPVLVVNGSNDVMAPTEASYKLYQVIPRAKLVLYPDSGHGALYQYHDDFVKQVDSFLRFPL